MIYLLSYETTDEGMRWPTKKYREFDDPLYALMAARALLLMNKIAVHIEPLEVPPCSASC